MKTTYFLGLFILSFVSFNTQAFSIHPFHSMLLHGKDGRAIYCKAWDLPVYIQFEDFNQCGNEAEAYVSSNNRRYFEGTVVEGSSINIYPQYDYVRGDMRVRGVCGRETDIYEFSVDERAPYTHLVVADESSGWVSSPVKLQFVNVSDDVVWNDRQYMMHFTVNELTTGNIIIVGGKRIEQNQIRGSFLPGVSHEIELDEGNYEVTGILSDACGGQSQPSVVRFRVDNHAPSASIQSPSNNMVVTRGSNLEIKIAVGDPQSGSVHASGIYKTRLFLKKRIGGRKEQLCEWKSPWIEGMLNRKSCTVEADWKGSSRKLILEVADVAGNKSGDTVDIQLKSQWTPTIGQSRVR